MVDLSKFTFNKKILRKKIMRKVVVLNYNQFCSCTLSLIPNNYDAIKMDYRSLKCFIVLCLNKMTCVIIICIFRLLKSVIYIWFMVLSWQIVNKSSVLLYVFEVQDMCPRLLKKNCTHSTSTSMHIQIALPVLLVLNTHQSCENIGLQSTTYTLQKH